MSCGRHLLPHRHPADRRAAIALFGLSAEPGDVQAWLWDNPDAAVESCRLNRDNHGLGDAVHGPATTEAGWVTLVDLREAAEQIRRRIAV